MFRINKAHPWHGIPIGEKVPNEVTVFIEIVPRDTVKYEVDKETGYLKIDRPQQYSNVVPANYGFIPQTYCAERIANLARENSEGIEISDGDGDPLDILVLSEHHIPRGDIILKARPIGGFCLIEGDLAFRFFARQLFIGQKIMLKAIDDTLGKFRKVAVIFVNFIAD